MQLRDRACVYACRRANDAYTSTQRIASSDVRAGIGSLHRDADAMSVGECQPISTSITLIRTTMEAWPNIITGEPLYYEEKCR